MAHPESQRWQIAFLISVAAVILASAVAFGVGEVTAAMGLTAIALGLINALVAKPAAQEHFAVAFVRRLVCVTGYFRALTVTLWIISLALVGWTVWSRPSPMVELHGTVLSADGRPVDGVVITAPGGVTAISAGGRFTAKVPMPKTKSISLDASWRGSVSIHNFPITGPIIEAVIRMPISATPLRTSYLELGGTEIDRLFTKHSLGTGDPGKIHVYTSDAYRFAGELAAKFKDVVLLEDPAKGAEYYMDHPPKESREFSGGAGPGIPLLPRERDYPSESGGWHAIAIGAGDAPFGGELVFWRLATREDAAYSGDSVWLSMWDYLTKRREVSTGMVVWQTTDECAETVLTFYPREARLIGLLLENLNPTPVRIGHSRAIRTHTPRLLSEQEYSHLLSEATPEDLSLMPSEYLDVGEKLFVPLAIELRIDVNAVSFLPFLNDSPESRQRWMKTAAASDTLTYFGRKISSKFVVNTLQEKPKNPDGDPLTWGETIALQAIQVDGSWQPLKRKRAETKVERLGWAMTGSCPYVMTAGKAGWSGIGTVLDGRLGPTAEGWAEISLPQWPRAIRFWEREAETTTLNTIEVSYGTEAGRKVWRPEGALAEDDQTYVRLEPGQTYVLALGQTPEKLNSTEVRLRVKGYYQRVLVRNGGTTSDWPSNAPRR